MPKFKPNKKGVKKLLKFPGVGRDVKNKADEIADTANDIAYKEGSEYRASELREGKTRYRATVYSANYLAQHSQYFHDSLIEALDMHRR